MWVEPLLIGTQVLNALMHLNLVKFIKVSCKVNNQYLMFIVNFNFCNDNFLNVDQFYSCSKIKAFKKCKKLK